MCPKGPWKRNSLYRQHVIYQTIEIILYAYKLEKLFKDEEKNSESRTNITFGDTFGDHC